MANRRASRSNTFGQGLKKFFLSAFVVITFIAYILHQHRPSAAAAASPTATSQTVPTAIPVATASLQSTAYRDGTFTGPTVDAFYGLVQVQVQIQGGKITNVQFLQYPNDRRTSQEINAQAMPWLTQEAIQAQSANVNIITGATLTSEAFANSLQAALQSATN